VPRQTPEQIKQDAEHYVNDKTTNGIWDANERLNDIEFSEEADRQRQESKDD
jgi:hypothetical protein